MLMESEFKGISISELCRRAGVERRTFYNHYNDLYELVDECTLDFTNLTDFLPPKVSYAKWNPKPRGKPFCLMMRENERYQHLFFDPELKERCINDSLIFILPWICFVLRRNTDLQIEEIESFITYSFIGCFESTRRYLDCSDEEWERRKKAIDKYNMSGMKLISVLQDHKD